MRNGNCGCSIMNYWNFGLFILPMRNGNFLPVVHHFHQYMLFILPMRNGNFSCSILFTPSFLSFYPTYEEWKPVHVQMFLCSHCLFILPMRNGNIVSPIILSMSSSFLSYLWGMETSLVPSVRSFLTLAFLSYLWGMETLFLLASFNCSKDLFILPMRNGNVYNKPYNCRRVLLFILPMRNGNLCYN